MTLNTRKPPDAHPAYLLYEPDELCYDFGPHHLMQSQRLQALIELLETSDLWKFSPQASRRAIRTASLEELQLVHTPEYIEAVQHLSRSDVWSERETHDAQTQERDCQLAERYGLAPGDTPAFP